MVHFVCSSDRPEVAVVRVAKPLGALVDENIVYQEIGHAVKGDTDCDPDAHIADPATHTVEE